jgi:polyisoprenoid-binding protein YceI
MKTTLTILWFMLVVSPLAAADGPCVIPGRGHFYIHTGTAGLFGAFAHDHLIEAQKVEGCATVDPKEVINSSIKLGFPTASLRVIDPKESDSNKAKIQKTMETDVLRVAEYPEVVFESVRMERTAADALRVHGNLTIRGKMQAVVIPLKLTRLDDGVYRATGEYPFKQTTFGIKPVQLGGGTIKVKDEIRAEFELFLK